MVHKRISAFAILVYALCLASDRAEAYQFVPTDAEWSSWPGHCQAKYVWTNIGKNSKFVKDVGPAEQRELAQWEDSGIRGVHHFCAGTLWLKRAAVEQDTKHRNAMLTTAQRETAFSLDRSQRTSPFFANVAIQMTTILYQLGEVESGLDLVMGLVELQPTNDVLYSAAAVLKRRLGQLVEAKEILLQGNEAVNGNSAEILYNLGLVSLELGEVDEAKRYAQLAYEKGYPLPGLRTKLQRLGHM